MPTTASATKSNPLVDLRVSLIENGYRIIPVKGKRPIIKKWSRLNIDAAQVESYTLRQYPDHENTGLLCGELVGVDIDAPDAGIAEKLIARFMEIPGAPDLPRRVGKPPKVMFVSRANEPREKAATPEFIVNGQKHQVEIMGIGQQIVAYGIHPETLQPYTWSNGDPLTIPLADLPVIAPEHLDAFRADAETILAAAGEPVRKAEHPARKPSGGESFWTRVNSASLAKAEAWVLTLFPHARQEAGTGAWRVTSKDLGRSLEEDISIHSSGIQDFGREKPETAIQLVLDYGGAPTPKDAAFWLCERMGVEPETLGWEIRAPVTMRFGAASAHPEAANDDDPGEDETPENIETPAGLADHLCYPPGAVGEFVRFIESCSRFPSPHLALVSALALTAGIVGRRYKGPTGLRSNIYIVGLAESGFGKDITIRAAEAIADSTSDGDKVSQAIFTDKLRSLPGLAGRLRLSPSCISTIDEFGKFLSLHTGRNVAPHREEITTALMELTGATQGTWGGAEKAGGNIARIVQPCFSIHGISTPSTFWQALSSGNISEGLLGRLILIDAGDTEPKKVRNPSGSLDAVPEEIAGRVNDLLGNSGSIYGAGAFYVLSAKADEKPWPIITAEFAPGVDDLFEGFDDRMRAMRSTLDPQYRPILNRVGENAAKLALIVAIGCDPKEPVITADIQKWANEVAEASFLSIVRGSDDNIADNDKSAEYLRVRRIIEKSGTNGLQSGIITKRLRGAIDKRRLEDIKASLREAGEIYFAKLVADSGQVQFRFWTKENLPSSAEVLT
ncbi:bifunctional DNA primase/polymerase [Mesorhizobium sp. A623]